MEEKLERLKREIGKITDLGAAMSLMSWDQEVIMPPGAAQARARQMSTVGGMLHELSISEEYGTLLEDLLPYAEQLDYDSDDASLIRNNWRDFQKSVRIPTDMMMAFYGAAAMAREGWKEGREKADFSIFQPHLEKLMELQLKMAEFLRDGRENLYDALLDIYETDLTYATVDKMFSTIKPDIVAMVKAIGEAEQVDYSIMTKLYPEAGQLEIGKIVSAKLGFDFNTGRLDLSTHPFTSGTASTDVRITTRVKENDLGDCFSSIIHEAGHGIHFQQLAEELSHTGMTQAGLSTCESQSRFYENIIMKSRGFWDHILPEFKSIFPDQLADADAEQMYRAINKVEPGLIRVEADEVTYGLHIMLRTELENDVVNGRVAVADLPREWNGRMEEYLGITPPDDAKGVLQDIHWSQSPMGYFPTYLLGSMMSVQLWEHLQTDIPDAVDNVAAGEFEAITGWMGEKIHKHGGKFTLTEMVERACGEELSSEPYMDYLKTKYGEIYGL